MRFGFHISISGGLAKVAERAKGLQCETIQIFPFNPRGWQYAEFDASAAMQMRSDLKSAGIEPVIVHASYLPNLASPNPALFDKSIGVLCETMGRAEAMGAAFVNVHVGSGMGASEAEALATVSRAVNTILVSVPNTVTLLLENTAGGGTELGHNFTQIEAIIDKVTDERRVGVCLDTAHAFEAGYDVATAEGLDATLEEFRARLGWNRLKALHLNDSRSAQGSHADRHWHIGEGEIGLAAFKHIVNHRRLAHLPAIMETPRTSDKEDKKNMRTVRRLAATGP
ncbi:MAG: deoxyribonuclease IV [Planctomycetota bacterium]|nr:deoxyribonuclease IV [Planctomycetota bacterium]